MLLVPNAGIISIPAVCISLQQPHYLHVTRLQWSTDLPDWSPPHQYPLSFSPSYLERPAPFPVSAWDDPSQHMYDGTWDPPALPAVPHEHQRIRTSWPGRGTLRWRTGLYRFLELCSGLAP